MIAEAVDGLASVVRLPAGFAAVALRRGLGTKAAGDLRRNHLARLASVELRFHNMSHGRYPGD